MILPFLKTGLRWHALPEDRRGRLCRLLERANVHYSRKSPEAALANVPVTEPPARVRHGQPQKFHFPLAMPARVALFEGGFSVDGALRPFAVQDAARLKEYVPEALVMPLNLALTLADQKLRKLLELPTLTRAIVVLTSPGEMQLEEHHRTLIWRAFGVPLFEQFCGWDGTVIARECEVHDGLHIDEAAAIFQMDGAELVATQLTATASPILRVRTGLTAEIVTEHCECGAETPRLRNIASLHAKAHLAVA